MNVPGYRGPVRAVGCGGLAGHEEEMGRPPSELKVGSSACRTPAGALNAAGWVRRLPGWNHAVSPFPSQSPRPLFQAALRSVASLLAEQVCSFLLFNMQQPGAPAEGSGASSGNATGATHGPALYSH